MSKHKLRHCGPLVFRSARRRRRNFRPKFKREGSTDSRLKPLLRKAGGCLPLANLFSSALARPTLPATHSTSRASRLNSARKPRRFACKPLRFARKPFRLACNPIRLARNPFRFARKAPELRAQASALHLQTAVLRTQAVSPCAQGLPCRGQCAHASRARRFGLRFGTFGLRFGTFGLRFGTFGLRARPGALHSAG
jgi:hypothetical protein